MVDSTGQTEVQQLGAALGLPQSRLKSILAQRNAQGALAFLRSTSQTAVLISAAFLSLTILLVMPMQDDYWTWPFAVLGCCDFLLAVGLGMAARAGTLAGALIPFRGTRGQWDGVVLVSGIGVLLALGFLQFSVGGVLQVLHLLFARYLLLFGVQSFIVGRGIVLLQVRSMIQMLMDEQNWAALTAVTPREKAEALARELTARQCHAAAAMLYEKAGAVSKAREAVARTADPDGVLLLSVVEPESQLGIRALERKREYSSAAVFGAFRNMEVAQEVLGQHPEIWDQANVQHVLRDRIQEAGVFDNLERASAFVAQVPQAWNEPEIRGVILEELTASGAMRDPRQAADLLHRMPRLWEHQAMRDDLYQVLSAGNCIPAGDAVPFVGSRGWADETWFLEMILRDARQEEHGPTQLEQSILSLFDLRSAEQPYLAPAIRKRFLLTARADFKKEDPRDKRQPPLPIPVALFAGLPPAITFDAALSGDPEPPWKANNRGVAAELAGDRETAGRCYSEAAMQTQHTLCSQVAWTNLVLLLAVQDKLDLARRILGEARSDRAQDRVLAKLLGVTHWLAKDRAAAMMIADDLTRYAGDAELDTFLEVMDQLAADRSAAARAALEAAAEATGRSFPAAQLRLQVLTTQQCSTGWRNMEAVQRFIGEYEQAIDHCIELAPGPFERDLLGAEKRLFRDAKSVFTRRDIAAASATAKIKRDPAAWQKHRLHGARGRLPEPRDLGAVSEVTPSESVEAIRMPGARCRVKRVVWCMACKKLIADFAVGFPRACHLHPTEHLVVLSYYVWSREDGWITSDPEREAA